MGVTLGSTNAQPKHSRTGHLLGAAVRRPFRVIELVRAQAKTSLRILLLWARGIRRQLIKPDGWQLPAKLFGVITVCWGLLMGLMSYHLDHLEKISDSAERSYYQVVSDLGSQNARVRVGALQRMAEVMLRPVPDTRTFSVLDAIKLSMGSPPRGTHPYHADLTRILRAYFVGLRVDHLSPSAPETEAIINLLAALGPEGWYEETDRPSVPRTEALAWLWNAPIGTGRQQTPADLFEYVVFTQLDLQDFDLPHANFKGSGLVDANFRGAHLETAVLDNSNLENANLTGAHLKFAYLLNARLLRADLEGADLRFARFKSEDGKKADASEAYLAHANLSNCDCQGIRLDRATLLDANLGDANFQNASFKGAALNESHLTNVQFNFADLRRAQFGNSTIRDSSFRYASLAEASFAGAEIIESDFAFADLRGADFTRVKRLDAACDWRGSNIAHVRGLSSETILDLRRRGAVVIPSDANWIAFQREAAWAREPKRPSVNR